MGFTKDSLIMRQKELQLQLWKLSAEIRIKEKQFEQLSLLYEANEQVLKDFATEEAITKAQDSKPNQEAEKKA